MLNIRLSALALAGMSVLSSTSATTLTEDFSADPLQNGWKIYGDTNLFRWDSVNKNLAVIWDSSKSNSYFYHSLGAILAVADDFRLEFDLRLQDTQATGSFELAVGFLNLADAQRADFSRPGADTPNLFEFDYFPDGGFGPSIDATLSDTNVNTTNMSDFYFAYDNLPLNFGVTYHVKLTHVAGQPSIIGEVSTNGQVYTSLPNIYAGPIADFRLDTLSITSYSAAGDTSGDSLLAHGSVGNFVATLPPPPVQSLAGAFSNGVWRVQFADNLNWLYTLQRTVDFVSWANVSAPASGNGTNLVLSDLNAPAGDAFYRVRAQRP